MARLAFATRICVVAYVTCGCSALQPRCCECVKIAVCIFHSCSGCGVAYRFSPYSLPIVNDCAGAAWNVASLERAWHRMRVLRTNRAAGWSCRCPANSSRFLASTPSHILHSRFSPARPIHVYIRGMCIFRSRLSALPLAPSALTGGSCRWSRVNPGESAFTRERNSGTVLARTLHQPVEFVLVAIDRQDRARQDRDAARERSKSRADFREFSNRDAIDDNRHCASSRSHPRSHTVAKFDTGEEGNGKEVAREFTRESLSARLHGVGEKGEK